MNQWALIKSALVAFLLAALWLGSPPAFSFDDKGAHNLLLIMHYQPDSARLRWQQRDMNLFSQTRPSGIRQL